MHAFPQLRKLEEKFANEVAVIGVHSAKFMAEKDTDNVRQAILRYDIEHPVANDADFEVWQQYAARAWPTFMFIDPQGRIIGKHEGEIPYDAFDRTITEMLAEFDAQGIVDRRPLTYKLEREKEWERPLSFPGKVLADEASDRLFIADSNHNRVVIATLDGRVRDVVGSGGRGLADGEFGAAQFNDPQGLALAGDLLYVADTKNHAIRIIDLSARTVTTAAGTGEQSSRFHTGGPGASTLLASPWDLVVDGPNVFIAMAGFHQLWRMDRESHEVRPHAGNGRERIDDGPQRYAQLAQPSGIVAGGSKLYFTDSETSAIRSADVDPDGEVKTIVGVDLFAFGDVDGVGDDVRLQHPLGIDLWDGTLLITDSYNNKIKMIFPDERRADWFLGSGDVGSADGAAKEADFHEPGGLSVAGDKLYIADTNNHLIRTADLATGEVSTLTLVGL